MYVSVVLTLAITGACVFLSTTIDWSGPDRWADLGGLLLLYFIFVSIPATYAYYSGIYEDQHLVGATVYGVDRWVAKENRYERQYGVHWVYKYDRFILHWYVGTRVDDRMPSNFGDDELFWTKRDAMLDVLNYYRDILLDRKKKNMEKWINAEQLEYIQLEQLSIEQLDMMIEELKSDGNEGNGE